MLNPRPRDVVRSNDRLTRGTTDRDMVCCVCYHFFTPYEASWKSAERVPCPVCGSRDTTPLLENYVSGYGGHV